MNRRKFVLSWGRKVFFGFSWPITSLLGLFYLQTAIFPDSFLSAFYFLTTFIGFFGGLNVLAYFILFAPIVLLFPSYYVSRIWALLIILALNAWILLDVTIFSQYRIHMNGFILHLMMDHGPNEIFGKSSMMILLIGALALTGGFWFRGNLIWRWMQKRFSNPVSNWYLVLIVVSLGISQFIEFRSEGNLPAIARMKYLFPWKQEMSVASLGSSRKVFGYPQRELKCGSKDNKHLFVFVLDGVGKNDVTAEKTPYIHHLAQHGTSFENHIATSANEDSYFSLLYGIPATYRKSFLEKQIDALLIQELEKRKYFIHDMVSGGSSQDLFKLLDSAGDTSNGRPLAIIISLTQKTTIHEDEVRRQDEEVKSITEEFHRRGLLNNAFIAFTSLHGAQKDSYQKENLHVPFILVKPARIGGEISHLTTHYDVAPTLMRDLWGCKGSFRAISSGVALETQKKKNWVLLGDQNEFMVYDFKENTYAQLDSSGNPIFRNQAFKTITGENKTEEIILEGLKEIIRFYKP